MKCFLCDWANGHHDLNCPKEETDNWRLGYNDGRSGEEPGSIDAVYLLGWNRGNVAREEAENGHDYRFD